MKDFSLRLTELRQEKGVSARDMSLSLGQSASYINSIENGIAYPKMAMFFYICEYLGITPAEFFDISVKHPVREKKLCELSQGLTEEQFNLVISVIEEFVKCNTKTTKKSV